MSLYGLPSERNLLDYDFARLTGKSPSEFNFKSLERAMDCSRDFCQAGIIYSDDMQRYLVRPSRKHPNGQSGIVTHLIVSRVPANISQYNVGKPITNAVNSSAIGTEIASTVLSCGAMILTAGVAIGGSAAVPVTAGASGALVAIAYAGAAATGLQCVNGLYRLYDVFENHGENVAWLDSQNWYVATSTALDLVSLASAGGALKEALATWKAMKSVSSLKAADWLKNYPRQDRARLTELIIRAQNPGISNKELKAAIRAGLYPKRFPIEPIQNELKKQLANTVNSALAFTGSAVSGVISAPGNIPRTGRYLIGTIQSLAVLQ